MMLWKVLHTETLKIKRTIALKMVVLAPAAVTLLVLFLATNAPFSSVKRMNTGREWAGLAQLSFLFWAALMMPLYITLETALVAGLDHADNQWKSLLARPVPRWTWYIAKLIVVVTMVAASMIVLVAGILFNGAVLPRLQTELAFGFPVPWELLFKQAGRVAGLAFLSITIQHWVSLRWRSFSVAFGVGIVAMVVGYVAAMSTFRVADWPQYFPWALPMLALSRHPEQVGSALWAGLGVGVLVSALGCLDFCRREVS